MYITKSSEKQCDYQQSSAEWFRFMHVYVLCMHVKFTSVSQPSSILFPVMNVWVISKKCQVLNLWIHGSDVCNYMGNPSKNTVVFFLQSFVLSVLISYMQSSKTVHLVVTRLAPLKSSFFHITSRSVITQH